MLLHAWTLDRLASVGDHDGVVSRRVSVYERLANAAPGAVVFTGSSQVREAIDVGALPIDAPALNLGASAKNPCRALPELEALRAARPSVVVIGVTYFDFADDSCDVPHAAVVGAAGGRLPAGLDGILPDADRDALRAGRTLPWRATRPWITPMLRRTVLGNAPLAPDPERPFRYDDRDPEPLPTLLARAASVPSMLRAPESDAPGLRALELTVAGLRADGVEVIVVIMPLHPGVTAQRRPADAPQRLRGALSELVAAHGAHLLDLEDAAPAEQFYDVTHLDPAGRAWFTARLAEALAPAADGAAR